ncbi:hypothetical protein D3C81_15950 [compost metagenome]
MFDPEIYQPARFIKFNYFDASGKFTSLVSRVFIAKKTDPDGMVHVSYDGLCGDYPGESFLLKLSKSQQEASKRPGIWIPHRLKEMLFEPTLAI